MIFTSSDSFFLEWLQEGLLIPIWEDNNYCYGPAVPMTNLQFLVLDNLSKADAKKYFLSRIPDDKKILFQLNCDSFDSVYSMTGGRIVYLNEYVNEVISNDCQLSGPLPPCIAVS